MRDAHLAEFLQIYYTNLADVIRATGSDPDVLFPKSELQQQLRQFGIYGVMMSAYLMPVTIADPSEFFDIEDIAVAMGKESGEMVLFAKLTDPGRNQEFVQRLKDVLADARHYGWS